MGRERGAAAQFEADSNAYGTRRWHAAESHGSVAVSVSVSVLVDVDVDVFVSVCRVCAGASTR
eukprot:1728255-Rhodomonas_salina.1